MSFRKCTCEHCRDYSEPEAKVPKMQRQGPGPSTANKTNVAADNEVIIVHEGAPVTPPMESLPLEFQEEWKRQPQLKGKYVRFMKFMLTSGTLADVTFVLKKKAFPHSEEKVRGHKCFLRRKSEFFRTLFSELWEGGHKNDVVDLMGTRIYAEDFRTFLEFVYTEEITLNNDNVLVMYYISNMYLGTSDFKSRCENYMMDKIDEQSALDLFKAVFAASAYGKDSDPTKDNVLLERLIDFICRTGEPMLDRGDLKDMDLIGLSTIFSKQKFNCRPLKLLRFCLGWIKNHCGRKALKDFREIDRRIRDDFRVPEHNGGYYHFPKVSSGAQLEVASGEPTMQASPDPNTIYAVRRFNSLNTTKPWIYRRNRTDRISFRVSEPIIITGLGFYGDYHWKSQPLCEDPPAPAKYDLDITIYVHGKPHREFLSVFRRAGSEMWNSTKIFTVDVDPCFIHSDTWYTIAVKIGGSPSYYGGSGITEGLFKCGNLPVVFEFKEACTSDPNANLANPTGVPIGQIPEIYFKVANDENDDDVVVL